MTRLSGAILRGAGRPATRSLILLAAFFLSLQVAFWWKTHHRLPEMGVVPDVPGKATLDVLSFGDGEFLFRAMNFALGNAGDTFGRFSPLYRYDMHKLKAWFLLLDGYDHRSDLPPTMVSYYFSQTQNTPDIRPLVEYLYESSKDDVQHKWWWLTQATYLALHKLQDRDLALRVSLPLTEARNVPMWVRQMPAFVYEQRGEMGAATEIMQKIVDNEKNISDDELRYMRYFVEERMHRLDELDQAARRRLLDAPPPPGLMPKGAATPGVVTPGVVTPGVVTPEMGGTSPPGHP